MLNVKVANKNQISVKFALSDLKETKPLQAAHVKLATITILIKQTVNNALKIAFLGKNLFLSYKYIIFNNNKNNNNSVS